jgi:hypothetical protein
MTLPNVPSPDAGATPSPVRDLIVQELDELVSALKLTGPTTVPALDKTSFDVKPPAQGFNISFVDPLTGAVKSVPVKAHANWRILDASGNPAAARGNFVADPPTLDDLPQALTFLPKVVEHTSRTSPGHHTVFKLEAEVQLEANNPLPPNEVITRPELPKKITLEIKVPTALLIPTLVAFFRHRSFNHQGKRPLPKRGFALIYVPTNANGDWTDKRGRGFESQLNALAATAKALRRKVQRVLPDLPTVSQQLDLLKSGLDKFAAGLELLATAIGNHLSLGPERVVVVPGNAVKNLNTRDILQGIIDDTEGENEISSLIIVGPPGTRVECFNARDHSPRKGQLNLVTDSSYVIAVRDLHTERPESETGGSLGHHGGHPFGDRISSFQIIRPG